ncbi:Rho GTPase activation protein [Athelia psychrophila]|uniref:Rho GTPase activation protein n=1 Tax=Athelia psychrophila TaxID=1759441 RepID=A0A166UL99_9AGAM|nr:Rho GTPase activation protein [Fibularhizoctonia sp. CBS 109695]
MPAASQPPPVPPTKANLKSWWNHFNFVQKVKHDAEAHIAAGEPVHTVFGKPLKESLRYASVQISTANAGGDLYVWGYIPVVVAKCGLYLKERATEVEGTFRVNGSTKRMRELQADFERAPRYGKSLDWKKENYTTHDVASVFRRYLTQMPEPVIPYDMYHDFRDALLKQPFKEDEVVASYKALILRMPRPNQYLLLYVLDLLSVFARKCEKNLMTASNLAVIFRPGLIAHPEHEMLPREHDLSQKVLEFLIAQQDWFILDIPPPPQRAKPAAAVETGANNSDSGAEETISAGWKIVGKEPHAQPQPRRITRRRTQDDVNAPEGGGEDAELSPVPESPPALPEGAAGVARRRTLPSGKASSGNISADEKQRARVLRKAKRTSSHQPRTRHAEPVAP